MHAPALPSRTEDFSDRRLETFVSVGDHQLYPAQTTTHQTAQEVRPERLDLGRPCPHAQNFPPAIGAHGHGDYDRDRNDTACLTHFNVGSVDPEVRLVALKWSIQKRIDALIDLAREPGQMAFRDAGHAHGFNQLVDRTC
ncbi:hypothetical protein ALO73_200212 [Pseudomonas syringae pv. daphniphylli]|uniref:Type IV secretion protein Rh n=1 Tax=Pseudomonas syringae pv. daphniphylli TaxID=264455 RepID=A0A9X0H6L9_PSESX|nr:hypothetical protein ALO73_200212 [Pseudomonas syringae pv. daphniphylli]